MTPTPRPDPAPPAAARSEQPIGYVLKCYPRFSETFIVREILAREAAGERIVVASLRAPRDPRFHAMVGRVQAGVTWIPDDGRTLSHTWAGLADLARLGAAPSGAALQALVEEEAEVAAQAVLVAVWALENGVRHLHAHFATLAGRTARLAARLTGLPWSVTAHAKDIFSDAYDPHRRAQVLTEAGRVVAVSDSTAGHLRATYPAARVERIYNGVEVAELAARGVRRRVERPGVAAAGTAPTVAAVGRFVEKKGWPVLLTALALLRDEGLPLRCALVGSGPLEAHLRQQRAVLGLEDLVDMPGPLSQDEVLDLVAGASAFAAPCIVSADGDRDGLPTVLLEAMALGTAVVSTPVSGVAEAVEDGRTGLLARPGDARSLADALRRLLVEPDLRDQLVHAASAHVAQRFGVAGQAERLARLTADLATPSAEPASPEAAPTAEEHALADGTAA